MRTNSRCLNLSMHFLKKLCKHSITTFVFPMMPIHILKSTIFYHMIWWLGKQIKKCLMLHLTYILYFTNIRYVKCNMITIIYLFSYLSNPIAKIIGFIICVGIIRKTKDVMEDLHQFFREHIKKFMCLGLVHKMSLILSSQIFNS